jgi:hypothetical protein
MARLPDRGTDRDRGTPTRLSGPARSESIIRCAEGVCQWVTRSVFRHRVKPPPMRGTPEHFEPTAKRAAQITILKPFAFGVR